MSKPTIFISHINEEKEIANALKQFLDKKFLKGADIFVSSHEESLKLGDDWFDVIKKSLKDCQLMILLCSPISITRQWLNFEAGAGWVKDIPVIPLCHSGMEPEKLPVPINRFQGSMLNNVDDAKKLFARIADILKMETPEIGKEEFFTTITNFENKVKESSLVSDVKFIHDFLDKQLYLLKVDILECIRTPENEDELLPLLKDDKEERHKFEQLKIPLNRIYGMFNVTLSGNSEDLVIQNFNGNLNAMTDNIKFLLTYNAITLPEFFKNQFHGWLFNMPKAQFMIGLVRKTIKPEHHNFAVSNIKSFPESEDLIDIKTLNPGFIPHYENFVMLHRLIVSTKKWIIDVSRYMSIILDSEQ